MTITIAIPLITLRCTATFRGEPCNRVLGAVQAGSVYSLPCGRCRHLNVGIATECSGTAAPV